MVGIYTIMSLVKTEDVLFLVLAPLWDKQGGRYCHGAFRIYNSHGYAPLACLHVVHGIILGHDSILRMQGQQAYPADDDDASC